MNNIKIKLEHNFDIILIEIVECGIMWLSIVINRLMSYG